jgi:uncharacterized protein YyaL (SSP411 family)
MNNTSKPNNLIHETSPYLLQHAYNPVNWYAWGEAALQKAKAENKPIIVSIGYATCHWCHVMERESFENQEIAALMNKYFVCIKIDREERQDLDSIYMEAVQAMGINGGWPLNVFLLPDSKPFYGGTYYPPQHWSHLLNQVAKAFENQADELQKSAEKLVSIINTSEIEKYGIAAVQREFNLDKLKGIAQNLAKHYDTKSGGCGTAPKFPMPSIYLFLLRYIALTKDEQAFQQTMLTLIAMAYGGIYDQIGGGFSRYATDENWIIPHFEKMLYDNGQLISLYSEAYNLLNTFETDKPSYTAELKTLFKNVVYDSIRFVKRELTGTKGNFYCALDADSEGIEGKFYVWTDEQLNDTGLQDLDLFKKYYNISPNEEGNWEHGYNILFRTQADGVFAKNEGLSLAELEQKVAVWKKILLAQRADRIRPICDDKTLTAWNALMLKGLCDAFQVFGEQEFYDLALQNAAFLYETMINGTQIWHTYKDGKTSLQGYADDYALVIEAFMAFYAISFEEKYLFKAQALMDYAIENFFDTKEQFFFYTDQKAEKLIARKKELFDNVIPASNSMMANNLYLLSLFFERKDYRKIADSMLAAVTPLLEKEVRYLSNWACLYTSYLTPTVEIAISGSNFRALAKKMQQTYYPNKILVATEKISKLPLLVQRDAQTDTLIYVCRNQTCLLPVKTVEEAWKQV